MWRDTVTVYRKNGDKVERKVIEGCRFEVSVEEVADASGRRQETKCFLAAPGDCHLRPGDRVLTGIGPETVDWGSFIPVKIPGLAQIDYVKPWFVDGQPHHVEAGRK